MIKTANIIPLFNLFRDTTITPAESEAKTESHTTDEQSQTQSEAQAALSQFWAKAMEEIRAIRVVS